MVCLLIMMALYINVIVMLFTLGNKSILDVSSAIDVIKKIHKPESGKSLRELIKIKLYAFASIAAVVTVLTFLLHRSASACA